MKRRGKSREYGDKRPTKAQTRFAAQLWGSNTAVKSDAPAKVLEREPETIFDMLDVPS